MSNTLGIADYVVIGIMLLISSGIGIYYRFTGGQQKTTKEYFLANRSMTVVPVAVGLMASFFSSTSLLGLSSEVYLHGTQFVVINFSYIIATWLAATFYLPVFFRVDATSSFEYLERRFGTKAKFVASSASLLQLTLYTSVTLYAPALALEATTGISTTISVIGIGLICTFYSTIGGMKAVLITDLFQSGLMFAPLLAVIITAAVRAGGIGEIWSIAGEKGRLEFDNFSIDPTQRHTWWCLVIGGGCTYLSLYGCNPVQIQRLRTIKKLENAKKALWVSVPVIMLMSVTTCFSGLALLSEYVKCDPKRTNRISSNDELMPLYIMDTLSQYPGLPGLLFAGIFSAALSTISATLNSLAATFMEDHVMRFVRVRNINISESRKAFTSKFLALLAGCICMALALAAKYVQGILQVALTILGVVGGPLLGLFSLGMFTETANQGGAIIGFLTSLVFSITMGFGWPKPKVQNLPVYTDGCSNGTFVSNFSAENDDPSSYFYLFRISYMWYCPLSFVCCFVCGWIASWMWGIFFETTPGQVHPDLLTPALANKLRRRKRKSQETDNDVEVSC